LGKNFFDLLDLAGTDYIETNEKWGIRILYLDYLLQEENSVNHDIGFFLLRNGNPETVFK